MKLWWKLGETDDELPITNMERRAIANEAYQLWFRTTRANLAFLGLLIFCVCIWYLITLITDSLATSLRFWKNMIAMIVVLPVFITGIVMIKRFGYYPILYALLREHCFDVCTKCGYWLKGLGDDTTHCPECGLNREENIANPQLKVPRTKQQQKKFKTEKQRIE